MNTVAKILGIPFSKMTLYETNILLEEHIQRDHSELFHLITVNPEITIASQSDNELRNII